MEPLLCDPERPRRIVFVQGLPPKVSIGANGQWEADDPGEKQQVGLLVTALSGAIAVLGFLWYAPVLVARLQSLLPAG